MSNIVTPHNNNANMDQESAPDIVCLAEQVIIQSAFSFPAILSNNGIEPSFFTTKEFKTICQLIINQLDNMAPVTSELIKMTNKEPFFDFDFNKLFDETWAYRDRLLNKNLDYYIRVLKEHHFKVSYKQLVSVPPVGETTAVAVETLIEKAKDLLNANTDPPAETFNKDWNKVLDIADDAQLGIFPHALKTHYKSLDTIIGEGILDDYLVIIGADSGAGKTTFALNIIRNVAVQEEHATLYLSFEMGRTRLMRWFMSACTAIPMSAFVQGKLTEEEWMRVNQVRVDKLCPDALVIIETHPEVSNVIRQIRARIKQEPNIRMILIDHLHLMHWSKSSQPVEVVSFITKALKQLAMELQVPIVLLAQLKKPDTPIGKTVNGTQDRRDPHVSDLKGSGSIITDADLIMILQIDPSTRPADNNRLLRAYVLKNRGGRADGTWVAMTHHADCCLITCN